MNNLFIDSIAIGNNFDIESEYIKNRGGIDVDKNKEIASLVNPFDLSYIENVSQVIESIKDKKLAKYQHNLISKRLKEISEETIDVDKIEITISLTKDFVKEILNVDNGFSKVGVKAKKSRLSIKESKSVGTKNRGFSKRHNKPFFTRRYSIIVDEDDYRSVEFYVADLDHPNNKERRNIPYNVEINFVPTRFTLDQLSLVFWHIKSKLKNTRFEKVMKNAKVRRFDVGYMLYGVSQLYGFAISSNANFKYGASYPEEEDSIQETSYIGRLQNNNRVAYEKVLKEFKFFLKYKGESFGGHDFSDLAPEIEGLAEWYASRVCTFRVEARHIADGELFDLNTIAEKVECGLNDVRLIKPRYLMEMTSDQLKDVLLDKSLVNRKVVFEHLLSTIDVEPGKLCFKFDPNKLRDAYKNRLGKLVSVITKPYKAHDAPRATNNYSQCAKVCKEMLKEIAKTRVVENPKDIAFSKEKTVYIEGCAGSGKTTLIADQIKSLHPKSRQCVQVWTFTNESVKDIKIRLNELLPSVQIKVDTISSWCSQQLRTFGLIAGDVINVDEAYNIIQTIIDDLKPEFEQGRELNGEIIYGIISHARVFDSPDLMASIKKINTELEQYCGFIEEVYKRYQDVKVSLGREDFDGLIELFSSQLDDKRIAKKYIGNVKYLFIDEVQDFNSRQWSIINKIKKYNVQIMVVGDPAQAMYQFRGAVPQKLNLPHLQVYRMQLNNRSTQPISDVTNKFRKKISNKFKNAISKEQKGELPRLVTHFEFKKAVKWIVKDIKSKKSWNDDIFILCRFNKEKDALIKACEKAFTKDHNLEIMTFHAAKGQQAETVYVVDPRFRWMGFTDANEELCNMYVALSRAEKNLTIVRSTSATVNNSDKDYRKRNFLDEFDENICKLI